MNILQRIRNILIDSGASSADVESIGEDENLFERGILDSIALIGLVLKIEEEFKLSLPTGDFDPQNFNTLGGIVRLLERRLEIAR